MDFWRNTLNSARNIVAPMVDQSELAWRILSRRHGAQLCYTPMLHSRMFLQNRSYREKNFTTCPQDRPLIAQFCGDDPETLLEAAKIIENQVDGIDINLGCPQQIAKKGHYGSYLQDEWELIEKIVKKMSNGLGVPVSCKIRIFPDPEKSKRYAKMLQDAGCKLLTVHGRTREQKGQNTGLADWSQIKAIREILDIPVFANGNILSKDDVEECLRVTGAMGVMTAEGNLYNPAIFEDKVPWIHEMVREYIEIVREYETPLSFVRGHLFKLFRPAITTLIGISFRESLGKVNNLDICLESALEFAQILEDYTTDESFTDKMILKCIPYKRPLPTKTTTTTTPVSSISIDEQNLKETPYKESPESIIKKAISDLEKEIDLVSSGNETMTCQSIEPKKKIIKLN